MLMQDTEESLKKSGSLFLNHIMAWPMLPTNIFGKVSCDQILVVSHLA
jgi:hypothetical protein